MDDTKVSGSSGKTVLVIEDDRGVGEFLTISISQLTPFQALWVTNAVKALEMVHILRPDLVILDYRLPDITGLELYQKFQEIEPLQDIPMLLVSANLPEQVKDTLPIPFLEKPFRLDAMLETIEHLLAE